MSADVRAFVASCYFCQTHKHPPGLLEGKLQPIEIPAKPNSLLGIDHIGPFRRTARGNTHILVAIDYFSIVAHKIREIFDTHFSNFTRNKNPRIFILVSACAPRSAF